MSNVHIYEEQPRLVYSFRDFIEIIESAAATYHEIDAPEGGTLTGEVRFNLFSSIEKYQSSLKSIFIRMVKEIDEAVNSRYAKLEKLNFLALDSCYAINRKHSKLEFPVLLQKRSSMPDQISVKDKSEGAKHIKIAPFRTEVRKTAPHKHNNYFEIVYLSAGKGHHLIDQY
jgi:hypothetical protein